MPPVDSPEQLAHELNNVLCVVKGYALLLAGRVEDERSRNAAVEIAKAADQGAQLTAGLRGRSFSD